MLQAPDVLTPAGLAPSPRYGALPCTSVGLTDFAVSSFLKDAVNRLGDLADDGKTDDSFKP